LTDLFIYLHLGSRPYGPDALRP